MLSTSTILGDSTMSFDGPRITNQISEVSKLIDAQPQRVLFLTDDVFVVSTCHPNTISVYGPSPSDEADFSLIGSIKLKSRPNDMAKTITSREALAVPMVNGDLVFAEANADGIKELLTLNTHKTGIAEASCVCCAENSVIIGGSNGSIVHIDSRSNQKRSITPTGSGVECLTALGGGSLLASGHMAGMLNIWDLRENTSSGRPSSSLPSRDPAREGLTALCAHPAQPSILGVGYESGRVGFVDARKATESAATRSFFEVAVGAITQVKFHPQASDNFFCSSEDGTVVHWDPTNVNKTLLNSSSLSRVSPWLSSSLEQTSRLSQIHPTSAMGTNGFDLRDDAILIAGGNYMVKKISRLLLV